MMKPAMLGAALAIAVGVGVSAEEFPLTFKAIPAKDLSAFPGGYGTYGQIRLVKPAGLKKEPKAISRHPLYGECGDEAGPHYVFRLDESKGDGKGYDQFIVDMNQNGDLTDDGVAERVSLPTEDKSTARPRGPMWFGPVQAPGKEIAGGKPAFYAQAFITVPPASALNSNQNLENFFAGSLRFKPAWYLEATVEMDGHKHKVGVFDGDGNLRLGDVSEPQTYDNGNEKNWYFRPADTFLVDVNRSGSFESDPLESEARPFGPLLYLDQLPYKASLNSSCTSLRLQKWTEPLAEVALGPKGEQVNALTLAWEHPAGKWQLVTPGVADGKIKVPPGRYRLYTCALLGKGKPSDQVGITAYQRNPKTPFKFEAGKANTLRCGAPLEVRASADKRAPQSWELPPGRSEDTKEASEYILRINANFVGADGEVYSSFAKGVKLADEPPKPTFTVASAGGTRLANGNLEFG